MMKSARKAERLEIEALLPWHAAGTLSRRDAQRVETALARDDELARQFALIREELAETIHLNETLGAPSARAMERVLAGIEADGRAPRSRLSFNLGFIAERLSRFSPHTLAWSASIAVLAIALQAGLLAGLYAGKPGPVASGTPSAASAEYGAAGAPAKYGEPAEGTYILIRFAPQASAADIAKFLRTNGVSVVEGPVGQDFYKIRLSTTRLPADEFDQRREQLASDNKVVETVSKVELAQ